MMLLNYLQAVAAAVSLAKIVLLSLVVAPLVASTLEPKPFGKVVRRVFPAYYQSRIVMACWRRSPIAARR